MRSLGVWLAIVLLALSGQGVSGEIGFVEDFVLAKDRGKALAQLIPGTEDYYYYHCLHCQNLGKLAEVEKILPVWIKRHGHTGRVEEIRNRQALLIYKQDPKRALDFVRNRLGLRFKHERTLLGARPKHPTSLDPRRIAYDAFKQRALARHRNSLRGFNDAGLYR